MTWIASNKRTISIALIVIGALLLIAGIAFHIIDAEIARQTEGFADVKSILELLDAIKEDTFRSNTEKVAAEMTIKGMINQLSEEDPGTAAMLKVVIKIAPLVPKKNLFIVLGLILLIIGIQIIRNRAFVKFFEPSGTTDRGASKLSEFSDVIKRKSSDLRRRVAEKPDGLEKYGSKPKPSPIKASTPPRSTASHVKPSKRDDRPIVTPEPANIVCSTCGNVYSKSFINCPACAFRPTASHKSSSSSEPPKGMRRAGDL